MESGGRTSRLLIDARSGGSLRNAVAKGKKEKKISTGQTRYRQTIQQQLQVGYTQTFPAPGLERDSVLWKTQPVVAMMNNGVNSAVHCGWEGGRGRQRRSQNLT